VAVGFLAFGYGLLRMAERLISGGADRAGQSPDQG
jgi:hypothetical protein